VAQTAPNLAAASGPARDFESRMADTLATFASAHVGNALRVQGHLLVAERFFLPWEEDDHLGLRAEYLALQATLRRVQRRPAEAIALFEEADRIASRGDFPGVGELRAQVRIAHARTLIVLNELEVAAEILGGLLQGLTEADLSPRARWMALQNLAECLSQTEQIEESMRVLAEADTVEAALDLPETDLVRTQWIRARIEIRRSWPTGIEMLKAVRERFIELGLLYDAALVSLELAEGYAAEITGSYTDAEHLAAIRELAAESGRFFAGQDISPEAAAALVLFQQVASWPVPTVIAFRKIEKLLRQAALS
jgi:hypothetical protein